MRFVVQDAGITTKKSGQYSNLPVEGAEVITPHRSNEINSRPMITFSMHIGRQQVIFREATTRKCTRAQNEHMLVALQIRITKTCSRGKYVPTTVHEAESWPIKTICETVVQEYVVSVALSNKLSLYARTRMRSIEVPEESSVL